MKKADKIKRESEGKRGLLSMHVVFIRAAYMAPCKAREAGRILHLAFECLRTENSSTDTHAPWSDSWPTPKNVLRQEGEAAEASWPLDCVRVDDVRRRAYKDDENTSIF